MTPVRKLAVITDRRGSGYGGAHYTGQFLQALREDGFAEVTVLGPTDYPHTNLPLEIETSAQAKLWKWLTGRTEADVDVFPIEALNASHARRPFDAVIVDGSLLGGIVPIVRRSLPGVKVITLFHNVELDFVDSRSRLRNPHLLIKRRSVARVERQAATADLRIALHAHDADRIATLYGRPVDHLFPITVNPPAALASPSGRPGHALFVGSRFKPNMDAVAWLHNELASASPLPIVIVGKGMETLRSRFADSPHFQIVGSVDDLEPWYANAAIVLSPITNGGGMKVKNVEALAHGKYVIATPHSAIGLEAAVEAGHVRLAETPEEWRRELSRAAAQPVCSEPSIAQWCADHFGHQAQAERLRVFLDRSLPKRQATSNSITP